MNLSEISFGTSSALMPKVASLDGVALVGDHVCRAKPIENIEYHRHEDPSQ
jgi:hypothetical protein